MTVGQAGTYLLIGIALLFGLVILLLIFRAIARRFYHRVPPNQVMVVYGRGRTVFGADGEVEKVGVRLVTGGGTIVMPVAEDFGFLDLTVMTIAKAKDEVYTVDGVPIRLDWVAQVQIDSGEQALLTAARAFLGMPRDEVKNVISQTLSANFRAIVGQLTVEDVHRDRDAFVQRVQALASDDMAAMGARVISMGIEEITDDQGYFEAMAKPVIAVVKRDALIAEAEADREARIKAARARREAKEAELSADRDIIEQRQALDLREVERVKTVGLAQAESDEAVQRRKASAIAQQQEAEVLVPARAQREAAEIEADAERRKVTITAEAHAEAQRVEASAQAEATQVIGRADAEKLKVTRLAEADGIKATLLAEAEGKQRLAEATAAEGEINLRQAIAELLINAEVAKIEALGQALRGVGENVRIVQFSGNEGGRSDSALLETLKTVPEIATIVNAKAEALSGENLEQLMERIGRFMARSTGQAASEDANTPDADTASQPEAAKPPEAGSTPPSPETGEAA